MGGMVAAIEKGFPQREIMEASYNYQKSVESKERIVIGVNAYDSAETTPLQILKIDTRVEEEQIARLQRVRETRNYQAHQKALNRLRTTAQQGDNLMPAIIEAVRVYAAAGEITEVLRGVFGEYKDPSLF